ncbi:MAG: permease [Patescibacteria group bacterium]|nr:permease [Patescibacteria group bacterium]
MFEPIQSIADSITNIPSLQNSPHLAEAVNFFIYDSIKITILLLVIMFTVNFVKSFFPAYKIKQILSSRFKNGGNISAALLGTITPFCSCSAIPLFIGLVESGVPLGVTFSYLISAPMVNEIAFILLLSLFGWKIAIIYFISGLLIAIIAGVILGKMKLEHLIESSVFENQINPKNFTEQKKSFKKRTLDSWRLTKNLFKKIFPYILIGVAIGGLIHGYAPGDLLEKLAGENNPLAVPIAVIIGIPLYSNAAGIFPVVQSLVAKGLPVGTALAFMMSVTALSLPEMIILKKIIKIKLLAFYVLIIGAGIIFTGYLFNIIL